jgi:hypothetical protein
MTLFERTCYVTGFNRGHAVGMREAMQETLDLIMAIKPPSSWTPEEKNKLLERAKQIDQKSAVPSGLTMGQLEATVSAFYDDYRNAPVCWDEATRLSSLSLKGNTPTEEALNAARKAGAQSGCPY